MISMDRNHSMPSALPEAPPEVSAWPSRAGRPRVDLSQLHINLILLDKEYCASNKHSTPTIETTCNTQESLGMTKNLAWPRNSDKSNVVTQPRRSVHKKVRFSEEEPVIIVYEQVDTVEEPQMSKSIGLRRRNVDVTPIKNVNYEGSFSSKSASCSNLLGAARIDVPTKEARTSISSSIKPIQIPTSSSTPTPLDIVSPATPGFSPVMEELSPSTSSDSSIDIPLTPTTSQSSPIILPVRRVSKLRSFLSFRRSKGQAAF